MKKVLTVVLMIIACSCSNSPKGSTDIETIYTRSDLCTFGDEIFCRALKHIQTVILNNEYIKTFN